MHKEILAEEQVKLLPLIHKYHSIKKIMSRCKTIFAHEFNERIFREQLAYFEDMNYSEVVKFMPGHTVTEKEVKQGLVNFSVE